MTTYEELLDHFKLRAQVADGYTIHSSYKLNRRRGIREKIETRWDRANNIGRGAFGQVWRELHQRPDGSYDVRAVKVIEKQLMTAVQIDFKKELLALAKFSKEEYREAEVLVAFLGWYETDQTVYLAMEYFEHGDLAQYVQGIKTEDEVRQITTDVLEGLGIIHGEGFAHRDLKPQNIFVVSRPPKAQRWRVKIGDFGISKRVNSAETAFRTEIGTRAYQAPEVQYIGDYGDQAEYSNSVDIWSLGCIVYSISAQKPPFPRINDLYAYCEGRKPLSEQPLLSILSQKGIDFVKGLLVINPNQRMTTEIALNDPWILDTPVNDQPDHDDKEEAQLTVKVKKYQPTATRYSTKVLREESPPSTLVIRPRSTAPATTLSEKTVRSNSQELEQRQKAASSLRSNPTVVAQSSQTKTAPAQQQLPDSRSNVSSVKQQYPKLRMELVFAPKANQESWITALAISPDGKHIVTGAKGDVVQLWDIQSGRAPVTLPGTSSGRNPVAISPDGESVVFVTPDPTISIPDPTINIPDAMINIFGMRTTITQSIPIQPPGISYWIARSISGIAISREYKICITFHKSSAIEVWDAATRRKIRTFKALIRPVSVVFSPDGRRVASAVLRGVCTVWSIESGNIELEFPDYQGTAKACFSPDGHMLAYGQVSDRLALCNLITGRVECVLHCRQTPWALAFSPDGQALLSLLRDGTVIYWDVGTGGMQRQLKIPVPQSLDRSMATISPDCKLIAVTDDKRVMVYDTEEL